MLIFLTIFFVGITRVDAAPFKIGDSTYDTLVDAVAALPTNGKLTFATDRFSSYAYGYTDTENPKALDNVMIYVVCFVVPLAGLIIVDKKMHA